MAEETGLILPLGAWVLETACAQLVRWADRAETAHLTVAVNVSAREVRQEDFVAQVTGALSRTGANPHQLKLELTESLLVTNVEDTIAKMTALRDIGVRFSLDDFGTGFSSLSYLKRLPLDQLKIDQSFVRDILVDANDAAIAKMVIALAGSMALDVIAEGVELEAQRTSLAEMGCQTYQGYLFSKPMPIDELEVLLAQP
ncbi:EAL domain-containing protein [Rhodoferax sp. PAMC 29310]|uniref:EAL domain-containing protein n=1 Tax=Rhodoferax sp. PAMC 29310 TaxID=2822760 RepID=UPI00351D2761